MPRLQNPGVHRDSDNRKTHQQPFEECDGPPPPPPPSPPSSIHRDLAEGPPCVSGRGRARLRQASFPLWVRRASQTPHSGHWEGHGRIWEQGPCGAGRPRLVLGAQSPPLPSQGLEMPPTRLTQRVNSLNVGTHVTGAPGAGLLQTPGRRAQRHVVWPLCEQVLLSLPVTRALQLRSFRKYKEAKQKKTRHQPPAVWRYRLPQFCLCSSSFSLCKDVHLLRKRHRLLCLNNVPRVAIGRNAPPAVRGWASETRPSEPTSVRLLGA